MLRIRSLEKSYLQGQTKIPVLNGLELAVGSGETVAILGQSGAGKSTLLSLMAGLDRPDAGAIEIAGKDIVTMAEGQLAKFRGATLGIIFQQFHLMASLTALENVALPLEIAGVETAEAKAREALARVGLGHREHHLPHELSGGECQRVAIARAFVVEPELLLADEPSGNLDDETGRVVMSQLFQMVKDLGMTMLLVTHNQELSRHCDRRFKLQGGQLHALDQAKTGSAWS